LLIHTHLNTYFTDIKNIGGTQSHLLFVAKAILFGKDCDFGFNVINNKWRDLPQFFLP